MPHKIHLFATGTNGGLTLASLGEFLSHVNWQNALTVLFGALTTGLSWYVSARQVRREQDRLDREESRQQRLEDVIQELKLRREMVTETIAKAHAEIAQPVAGTSAGVVPGG
jgi:hypothetical protein